MGLLDDAIREHLDLKRARGGDPAEIERMEREALGPVRREPTIGSPRYETPEEPAPREFREAGFHREPEFHEPALHDEHLTDLEELQELGYHDSTAPHLHPHHEHPHPHHEPLEPHTAFDDTDFEPEVEEIEQPKRRFLRRNRPASLSEPAAPLDPGFHEEPPLAHHEPVEHAQEPVHLEPELAPPPPPHLQFEHPPKRPRFTAEPPSLQPEPGGTSEPPDEPLNTELAPSTPPAPEAPAPAPARAQPAPEYEHFDEPPAEAADAQETTEFDVQKHLAETPRGQEEDEDVLEETPDFLQDTPEHDRLWFEQRPPKDFDFNG